MLFNTHVFIFLFLPITAAVFFVLGRSSRRLGAAWLTASSLFFYGWWNPMHVWILAGSILVNHGFGGALLRAHSRASVPQVRALLAAGVGANLLLLGWFKYAGFFHASLGRLTGASGEHVPLVLPLGISFFTFTQIAYLVDASRGEARAGDLVRYGLFVTYFPHLIAGPILHHREMMPQFDREDTRRLRAGQIAVGMTIFAIGLAKKVLLADTAAPYAQAVFGAAAAGRSLSFIEAWAGALGYSFQLYFDFSGYSDMAIGISALFGIALPLNFFSPYQAVNIIDFWRRWHITLSRFLRDYLYIPLGGSRRGGVRRALNLMVTMLLGGLWHGAGWTFVLWGGLHGLFLGVNHGWHALRLRLGIPPGPGTRWGRSAARTVTFLAVVVGWVLFRAASVDAARRVLRGMVGLDGVVLPAAWLGYAGAAGRWLEVHGAKFGATPAFLHVLQGPVVIAVLAGISWWCPNTRQIMARTRTFIDTFNGRIPAARGWLLWAPRWEWAAGSALLMAASVIMIDRVSEFLYFQF